MPSDAEKRDFAAALTRRFSSIPPENASWFEALLAAALDETQGDLKVALKMADSEYANDPEGPNAETSGGPQNRLPAR